MRRVPGADGERMNTNSETGQGFSEEKIDCHVVNIGLDGFAECLDVGPKACPYALPFGYAFLCQHPQLAAMLEKTRKEKMVAAREG